MTVEDAARSMEMRGTRPVLKLTVFREKRHPERMSYLV